MMGLVSRRACGETAEAGVGGGATGICWVVGDDISLNILLEYIVASNDQFFIYSKWMFLWMFWRLC